jgi:epoxyqueuosine reductase QueG
MKENIGRMICDFIREYEERPGITTRWGDPLVGFADAKHPDILDLKHVIGPAHKLPEEILPGAKTVIAYFVPFTKELAFSNHHDGDTASPQWAQAYEETNAMFRSLNEYLIGELRDKGYDAAVTAEAYTFDREKLISNWSQRHFARAAGLGTFGINNMLITKKGCCGRYGTVVSNLDVQPDAPVEQEYCIYKKNGRCGACFIRCPSGTLTPQGYDRKKCYEVLRKNAERYQEFGCSYDSEEGGADAGGSEVCGKCVTNVPCAFLRYIK